MSNITTPNIITTPPRTRDHSDATPSIWKPWWHKEEPEEINAAADTLAVLMDVFRSKRTPVVKGEIEITDALLAAMTYGHQGTVTATLAHLASRELISIRPSPDCKFLLNESDRAYWIELKPRVVDLLNSTSLEVTANTACEEELHDEVPTASNSGEDPAGPQSEQTTIPSPK